MDAKTVFTLLLLVGLAKVSAQYEPTWDSLDKRPLPAWYDEAKLGIFIHWGVFSVPSFGSEWFWQNWHSGNKDIVNFMKKNFKPNFTYADFGPMFTAEFYDPDQWADLFKASGAQYVVLTSKHHEGYTMWPSKYSWNWNAQSVGPNRDLVGDLATAIRHRTNIKFGLYHSLFEWFHPLYLLDKANNFTTYNFPQVKTLPELYELVVKYQPAVIWSDGDWETTDLYWNSTGFLAWLYNSSKAIPELYEIVNAYRPAIVWSDGDAGPDTYWRSQYFLQWLYNSSPVKDIVVTNDRWGSGTACKHGGYYTCQDKYNPGVLQKHKWENCMTIDSGSWGFRRNAKYSDYLTIETLIKTFAETVSCGGNLLMNVGPTHDGRIIPIFEERLLQMGQWLKINGEAIYSSKPWTHQNDTLTPGVWFTSKSSSAGITAYAIVLQWPANNLLTLGAVTSSHETTVSMLGYDEHPLAFKETAKGLQIAFPTLGFNQLPWSWVLKMENVKGKVAKTGNDL